MLRTTCLCEFLRATAYSTLYAIARPSVKGYIIQKWSKIGS